MQGENYLILLAGDAYDVPHRGADGEKDERREERPAPSTKKEAAEATSLQKH